MSFLGVVETILAMSAYIWITFKVGILPFAIASAIAPLLLLRTRESTRLALGLFDDHVSQPPKIVVPMLSAGVGVLIGMGVGLAAVALLVELLNLDPRHGVGSVLMLLFLGPLELFGFAVGGTVGVRFGATAVQAVLHPVAALARIPANWWRIVACVDVLSPPELLPGALLALRRRRTPGILEIAVPTAFGRALLRSHGEFLLPRPLFYLLMLPYAVALLVAYAVALSYRWAVKGTALLYFPLILLVWDGWRVKPEHVVNSIAAKGFFAGSCVILLTALGAGLRAVSGTDLGLLKWHAFLVQSASSSPIAAAYLPRGSFPAWQVLCVAAGAVIFWTYLYADRLKNRGWTNRQLQYLRGAYGALGCIVVLILVVLIVSTLRLVQRPQGAGEVLAALSASPMVSELVTLAPAIAACLVLGVGLQLLGRRLRK